MGRSRLTNGDEDRSATGPAVVSCVGAGSARNDLPGRRSQEEYPGPIVDAIRARSTTTCQGNKRQLRAVRGLEFAFSPDSSSRITKKRRPKANRCLFLRTIRGQRECLRYDPKKCVPGPRKTQRVGADPNVTAVGGTGFIPDDSKLGPCKSTFVVLGPSSEDVWNDEFLSGGATWVVGSSVVYRKTLTRPLPECRPTAIATFPMFLCVAPTIPRSLIG